jgi:hypothetical protein
MGPATEQPRHFGKGKAQLFPFSENVFTPGEPSVEVEWILNWPT